MNVGGAIFGFVIQSLRSKIASRRGDTRRTGAILVARKSHAFRALKLLLANYPKAVHRKARPDTSCIEARGLPFPLEHKRINIELSISQLMLENEWAHKTARAMRRYISAVYTTNMATTATSIAAVVRTTSIQPKRELG
jgi:hypothetical protein